MFDPYHRWLGIPPGPRPPTYYQLLGVARTEADPEVIKEAALRQTAHVRTYQAGPRAEECTRLLNEIAQARTTLLNPAARQAYDDELTRRIAALPAPTPSPAVVSLPAPGGAPAWEGIDEPAYTRRRRRHGTPWWADLSILAYVALLILVGTASFWLTRRSLEAQPERPTRDGRPAR